MMETAVQLITEFDPFLSDGTLQLQVLFGAKVGRSDTLEMIKVSGEALGGRKTGDPLPLPPLDTVT